MDALWFMVNSFQLGINLLLGESVAISFLKKREVSPDWSYYVGSAVCWHFAIKRACLIYHARNFRSDMSPSVTSVTWSSRGRRVSNLGTGIRI